MNKKDYNGRSEGILVIKLNSSEEVKGVKGIPIMEDFPQVF